MAASYMISLDLKNKKCLVVGGGKVAERKVRSLLECGALVYLV
ncbi:MAG: NAD(P)-dependent oxidoreductase, partial [Desulfotomaculaceae bacterium]|nr:NAD(P)-dependent oxidoreductase [Desulfotomaculaceae bacterium]